MKLVASRGLAEAGRVRGWLDLWVEFRVTEEEVGRGLMEDGRESNEDWEHLIWIISNFYFYSGYLHYLIMEHNKFFLIPALLKRQTCTFM